MGTMDGLIWTAVNEFEKGSRSMQEALNMAVEELKTEIEDS